MKIHKLSYKTSYLHWMGN